MRNEWRNTALRTTSAFRTPSSELAKDASLVSPIDTNRWLVPRAGWVRYARLDRYAGCNECRIRVSGRITVSFRIPRSKFRLSWRVLYTGVFA